MNMLQNLPFLSATRWFLSKDDSPPSATAFDGSVLRSREEPEKSGKEDDFAAVKSKLKHGYNINVESMRVTEYPYLRDATYLDHAGTTLYASSLMGAFSQEMLSNLYGNPHSQSPSSQLTTRRVQEIRLRVLQLLNADPDDFDVVFCANATAGMKIVMDLMRGFDENFDYRFHKDAHTSLVGIRESAGGTLCLSSDEEVEKWLDSEEESNGTHMGLFAWPAQSNFTGRRLPRDWAKRLRESKDHYISLLDAASLLTSSTIDLNTVAPDFTVLSFYKMFGFPDLGALVVRKSSLRVQRILGHRRYFGGGTVAAVVVAQSEPFHMMRNDSPHQNLEDGTPPFHSILALDCALSTHEKLFGGFSSISAHTSSLIAYLHDSLSKMEHSNGKKLCTIYSDSGVYDDPLLQGPIICLNLRRADGMWVGYSEVEKLAAVKKIHIRTGGLCNPGGVESYIGLQPQEIKQNYYAGHRCWDDQDVMRGRPTGAIRISLGAMSTVADVVNFVDFLDEFYVDKGLGTASHRAVVRGNWGGSATAVVESLNVYPIKSCGGYKVPAGINWEIKPHGLVWDREWCVVHMGTGSVIDQKRYYKMALIRPGIDLEAGLLVVNAVGFVKSISIPLYPSETEEAAAVIDLNTKLCPSRVCGDKITAMTYRSPDIVEFFSEIIGVPCTLARFPSGGDSKRYFKPHLIPTEPSNTGTQRQEQGTPEQGHEKKQILLSNESPILIINRSSIDKLNDDMRSSPNYTESNPPKAARAEVFRANIIISPVSTTRGNTACCAAYAEDSWSHIRIGREYFELLGPCRRCHMVCIDQDTGVKNEEPYVTLSKTRRIGQRIVFGQHAAHLARKAGAGGKEMKYPGVKVGDLVRVWEGGLGKVDRRDLAS